MLPLLATRAPDGPDLGPNLGLDLGLNLALNLSLGPSVDPSLRRKILPKSHPKSHPELRLKTRPRIDPPIGRKIGSRITLYPARHGPGGEARSQPTPLSTLAPTTVGCSLRGPRDAASGLSMRSRASFAWGRACPRPAGSRIRRLSAPWMPSRYARQRSGGIAWLAPA